MAEIVTRAYSNFRGVDFRGEEINIRRSPDSLNMWRDYKETESIRTRPGLKLHTQFEDEVQGIHFFKDFMIVHALDTLYKVKNGVKTVLWEGLGGAASNSFVYDDKFYFMDGYHYLVYDGVTMKEVEGYVPTTSIARKPDGGGTIHEDVNMLTGRRINTFLADGKSTAYYLDAKDIDKDFEPVVTFTDQNRIQYQVDYDTGRIDFVDAPSEPLTDGQDNISIEFRKTVPKYKDNILRCTLIQVFDNRVFFSGNPNYPNVVWHCSLHDPSYCSDMDYYEEGLDSAAIKGLVAGNNALWVFREPSSANTTVFYHTPTLDDEYGKIYPSTHSSVTTGCVGKAINFNDDIVFFSERGMEGISGDVTTEQIIAHRSSVVDRKLLTEKDYKNMILAEWEGYLMVFVGNRCYLADSRGVYTNEDHTEYDWFYWDMGTKITSAKVHDGVLYLGADDAVYTLTGGGDVESYWTTPKDKFKYANKLKTSNKRGCVAEAMGDISVYAKVEDTEFELIGEYQNVTDYFVSRIKRKKFKDIQLKFHSKKRFSLETITLECFVGGYIKR
jgi:hypothetical protein